jgi:crotonobetainyl-CoA:carnitine CoA-transferase CaiB-like acyl-CoA transferase
VTNQGKPILTGLKVVDMTRALAGPYCGMTLADHGADVIKIEPPTLDETRRWGPPFTDETRRTSAYFEGLNRNKKNIVLDLKLQSARDVLLKLISEADIVIDNFLSGTMAGWGMDFETVLAPQFPKLIYCQISGFGNTGPMGGRPGYDLAVQAFGGVMSINGEADGTPMRVGVPIVDQTTGHLAVEGILLALLERGVSGKGQLVDVTLLNAVSTILHPHSAGYLRTGVSPVRTGNVHQSVAPYQVFPTAHGGSLFVAAASDKHFQIFAETLGRHDIATDPRFATNQERVANVKLLSSLFEEECMKWDSQALGLELTNRGVPATPVHTVGEFLESDQVAHREIIVTDGDYRGIGVPIKFGRSTTAKAIAPSEPGAQSNEILREYGFQSSEIEKMRAEGAVK